MADKVEFYSQMAQFEAVNITQTHLNWSGFLATAARFYKYPYDAQLMIYYQRPEATAVAPFDTWNTQMRRYIKRGSKGIAVLDNSGDAPKVQYLFDIADTGTRHNSRSPNQWTLLQEHEPMLQTFMEDYYGIEREVGMLENQLEVLAMDLANRYWEDNSSQLIDILAGTHISEYDSFTQGANFRKALSNSILYQLISRCFGNADDFLGEEDFDEVPDFDTPRPHPLWVLRSAPYLLRCFGKLREQSEVMIVKRKTKGAMKAMTELTYTQVGDYLFPNIRLKETVQKPLTKYGRMRRAYLQEHNPLLYSQLVLTEQLFPHLWEIQEAAQQRVEQTMNELLIQNPAPSKENNQMGWVQHMNSLKAQAEEIVMKELIYS